MAKETNKKQNLPSLSWTSTGGGGARVGTRQPPTEK